MTFRWGIFGTGAVAAKFVAGLRSSTSTVGFVASRSTESAHRFASAFGIERALEGYESAARVADVDAIYIATPPSEHLRHALACLEHGTPILVEKPFASSADEARQIAEAARSAGVFCMEGMWTRFLPAALRLREVVHGGAIGEVRLMSGSLGFANQVDPASGGFDRERGGGALAHLAVYPISLGQWLFGAPAEVRALGRIGSTGVDEDVSITLRYDSGVLASVHASLRVQAAQDFRVSGTHGSIAFGGPIYRPHSVFLNRSTPRRTPRADLTRAAQVREGGVVQRLAQLAGILPQTPRPTFFRGNGYQYEAAEVVRRVSNGELESPTMPLSDSVAVAATLDAARESLAGEAS